MLRLSEFSSIFYIIKEIYENENYEKVTQIKQVVIRYSKITRILTIYFLQFEIKYQNITDQ